MQKKALSVQVKSCQVCGAKFDCSASETCWCKDVSLSEKVLESLRKQNTDCLCPACLKKLASS